MKCMINRNNKYQLHDIPSIFKRVREWVDIQTDTQAEFLSTYQFFLTASYLRKKVVAHPPVFSITFQHQSGMVSANRIMEDVTGKILNLNYISSRHRPVSFV